MIKVSTKEMANMISRDVYVFLISPGDFYPRFIDLIYPYLIDPNHHSLYTFVTRQKYYVISKKIGVPPWSIYGTEYKTPVLFLKQYSQLVNYANRSK